MSELTLKVRVDTDEAAQQLGAVLQGSLGYELESAIASTVELLTDLPRAEVFDRLAAHLDALLVEQLRLVKSWESIEYEPNRRALCESK